MQTGIGDSKERRFSSPCRPCSTVAVAQRGVVGLVRRSATAFLLNINACCFPSLSLPWADAAIPRCNLGPEIAYEIGNPVMLCFFLSGSSTRKMVFRLKVDEHASVALKGSQGVALGDDKPLPVYTWVAGTHGTPDEATSSVPAYPLNCENTSDVSRREAHVSCPQVFSADGKVVLLLNLVVNLQHGKLTNFAWDNGCSGCGPSRCMESHMHYKVKSRSATGGTFKNGACGQDLSGCPTGETGACDMKVFVTWAGSDSAGRHLLSAGMRLSKFTGYTMASIYETMSDSYKR
eukprot:TRINITY_DN51237_c0_g1_i1.p1 TRINITY_DN51237_c0_g1~~TRINITY_DN51237_c0_g1_i1.p1  ORF type:complete len:291 (-),score=22.84 TRINITY_DN51237_c0_g1_i1:200-1072(-)